MREVYDIGCFLQERKSLFKETIWRKKLTSEALQKFNVSVKQINYHRHTSLTSS